MTITAKFSGCCTLCGTTIATGQKIEWERGHPVYHTVCGEALRAGKRIEWKNGEPVILPQLTRAERPIQNYTCRKCGVRGQGGSYPFSTFPAAGYCDDCGA